MFIVQKTSSDSFYDVLNEQDRRYTNWDLRILSAVKDGGPTYSLAGEQEETTLNSFLKSRIPSVEVIGEIDWEKLGVVVDIYDLY